ncbi:gamma-glutamyl-gamma-aminobutyrate hydrolase family protein [Allohahella marinimesophila]|uniref:Glutamine amidotransferase n=1 Tax=Allohahella marinimesophila TaxID=1054972 RepID=A0ABP7P6Z4_9GAMM
MARRPIIAVTGPDTRYPIAWWATSICLRLLGGSPVRLTPRHPAAVDQFDGVIIGGGDDIDPQLYGDDESELAKIDTQRDAFEVEMIRQAIERKTPLMGICRGMQLINVVLGGTLFPDIRPMRAITSNRRTPFPLKTALIQPKSRLGRIIDVHAYENRIRINSLHHQAIDQLGNQLEVAGRDLDQLVQAVESNAEQFIIGVQWHPEYLPYLRPHRRLFRNLISSAAEFRLGREDALTSV